MSGTPRGAINGAIGESKATRSGRGWTALPAALLANILSMLAVRSVSAFSSIHKTSRNAAREDHLWKERFKRHFPDGYLAQVAITTKTWKVKFQEAHQRAYPDLPASVSRLFTAVKDNNPGGLAEMRWENLSAIDINGISLLS